MIKTNPDINYGSALTRLFNGLKDAEKTIQSKKQDKYPYAYGQLSMAVKMALVECSEMDLAEIQKQLEPNDKIPDGYPEAPTLYLHEQLNWD